MKSKENSFEAIWEIVKLVPSGRVSTYGAISVYLGTHPRIVGYALKASHLVPDLPAHRIVNRLGVLTGKHHFSTPDEMKNRLDDEGVKVDNNTVIDFKTFFWDPTEHLL